MRFPKLAFALALAAAPLAATAAPLPPVSSVEVTIGPALQAKAADYGPRELSYLESDLRNDVQRSLAAKGLLSRSGAPLHLVIVDARPNRPTFAQLSRNPSLSMRSIAIGGATIDGDVGGRRLHFQYWENDIRNERGAATWTDAEQAFQIFAHNLADGRL